MSTIYLKVVFKFKELNMIPLKYIRIFSVIICFLTLFSLPAIDSAFSGSEDVTVTNVTRISHPAYRATNQWYSVRDPWSRNFERVMMYEATAFTHPDYNKTGRGLVWGYISKLKSWTTLQEYESAARPLPKANNRAWQITSVYWSPFSGEENLVYGVVKNDNRLMKVNVDTGAWETVISFDPGDGTDLSNARSIGWTFDNNFTVNFNGEWSGGYEIDVKNKTRKRYSKWPTQCSEDGRRFPINSHGHSDKSPDGTKMAVEYGQTHDNGVINLFSCNFTEDLAFENRLPEPYPHYTVFTSWKASEDWFLVTSSPFYDGSENATPVWLSSPERMTYAMWQVYFDGSNFTYREILRAQSAGAWDPDTNHTNGNEISNSQANLKAVLRKDGRQIWFTMTDNKYTYEDYQAKGVAPWGFEGVFLADLATTGSDTSPPAPPKGLSILP